LIRIAAVGDLHVGRDTPGFADEHLQHLNDCADMLLVAGDLTQHGYAREAAVLSGELGRLRIPMVCVLGNHDHHQNEEREIRESLEAAGARVLEGEHAVFDVRGVRVGVAGSKGFGGGFAGACGSEFGETQMKAFIRQSRCDAANLERALLALDCDVRVALMHYAPARGTLAGEALEIYPFLGSYFLGQAVDAARCAVAFHGHAHAGTERGLTEAGVPVRNVARSVLKLAYKLYELNGAAALEEAQPVSNHHGRDAIWSGAKPPK
jgi:Icc-related predicted phosphoesterase